MTLPSYFLADLPPEATVSATMLSEACDTLRRNRSQYLERRSTGQMIHLLADVGRSWLEKDFPLRLLALQQGPENTGFSRATLERGLDSFFGSLTAENLQCLVEQDFGAADRLDRFSAVPAEHLHGRRSIARGPELLVHIAAGNVPNPTFTSITLGLLVRSAQIVKCATGGAFLPLLFAHSIYQADRKVGACLEVAQWPGGDLQLERVLFDKADCITATGTDETLTRIRLRLPAGKRFLAYGHRVSFSFVSADMLSGPELEHVVSAAAADVCAWDQLGCLSPHVIYVETGGGVSAEGFGERLAAELDRCEELEPRGILPAEGAAFITNRRSIYQLRSANSPDTRIWSSDDSTAWTVVYESEPRFQSSCLNRFVYVKRAGNLSEALEAADHVQGKVSTVALATSPARVEEHAMILARWGVTRICQVGQMQSPPFAWRHDGRPALGDLVTWTDWEV
jgi:hypothetical protein